MKIYDKIIIGAGIYGLYAALKSSEKGENILVIEFDNEAFSKATYVNQARVHNGYHYPRSYSTAIKSKGYFEKFNEDFGFAINKDFYKIYATSAKYSYTNAEQFKKFCNNVNIKCNELGGERYFKEGLVDGVFETEEYSLDALKIKNHFVNSLNKCKNVDILYGVRIQNIEKNDEQKVYRIISNKGIFETSYLLNATYGSINQIIDMLNYSKFNIKYEICEIILCYVSDSLKNVGITVMDGPFFSIMPFGLTGLHSLTSVTFTPHITSYDSLPSFPCQKSVECSPKQLYNCNICPQKPKTSWDYMYKLAKKYLHDNIELRYVKSLYSVKSILLASEIDDSRHTVIKRFSEDPTFISVLSGKINTIYDLDEVL